MKKKVLVKFAGFMIIFIIVFAYFQSVFIPKGVATNTVTQFYNEPKNSIDVLILGASGTRMAILPSVLWDEAGISSYNLSIAGSNIVAQYYLLNEALRYQSPSLVIVTQNALFSSKIDFDNDRNEARFRQVLDNMRWSKNKIDSIKDILINSEQQAFLDYLLPLIRYKDRHDLRERDYNLSYKKERNLYVNPLQRRYTPQELPDPSNGRVTVNDEYLTKIVDKCKQNNIEVIILATPSCRTNRWIIDRHEASQEFADIHGITNINFNTPELYNAIGLDTSIDFYDDNHVNLNGGTKVSCYLARYLSETFILSDHRVNFYDSHWDALVQNYNRQYNILLRRLPGNNIEAISDEEDLALNVEEYE